jgi:hypothetical protein
VTPQRIQLSRRKGFSLQRVSRELNGLPAINCAPPGKWGNPYTIRGFVLDLALDLFERSMQGYWLASGIPDGMIDRAYHLHSEFRRQHNGHPLDASRI